MSRLPAGLKLALGFLTTLPVPPLTDHEFTSHSDLPGQSFAWYPLIGALLGALLSGLGWLLRFSHLSALVQAGCLLTIWVLLSGGLHLDGLLDTCDALFASVTVARRLEILKDVHTGAFGVIGLVLVVGLKWVLLAQLVTQYNGAPWSGLFLAPVWGRWILVWTAQRYPYARSSTVPSLGNIMRQGLGARQLRRATLSTLLIFAIGLSLNHTAFLVLFGPLAGLSAARWAANRLDGGLTGDVYGALCEVTELFALLGLALAG